MSHSRQNTLQLLQAVRAAGRRRFVLPCLSALVVAIVLPLKPAAQAWQAPELPSVLILGDSISIGYTPHVAEAMAGEATVARPTTAAGKPENCQGTTHGVEHIDRWLKLGDRQWSVIHFNFGLHDLKRVDATTRANSNDPDDPPQATLDVYEKQLRAIVARLKTTGATLVFATTTPVPPGGVKPHRDTGDPQRYNERAVAIMKEHGIAVNDLFAAAQPRLKEIQRPVNVHFTDEGSKLLADEVCRHIREALPKKNAPTKPE